MVFFITCDGNHSSVLDGQERRLVDRQCGREGQQGGLGRGQSRGRGPERSGGPAPQSSNFSAMLKTSPCREQMWANVGKPFHVHMLCAHVCSEAHAGPGHAHT